MAPRPQLPGRGESYWMHTSGTTTYPPLTEDVEVDVVVVGGGIAGLSTAWELTHAGLTVAVLEADRIAAGVTGYTTAKVSALHTLVYDRLRRTHGEEAARLYATSQQGAVERVAEICAGVAIDCDLERVPAFTYSVRQEGTDILRAEAEAAREAGLPARYTEDTGLPFAVAGAVRVDDQAQFHPRRYLLALAEDLVAQGCVIFERSRVTEMLGGIPCTVTTEAQHTVTAHAVVVTTHYPIFDRALLFARLQPRRELVVAAPLASDPGPPGMFITEDEGRRSVRTAPYGSDGQRLLIVTGESFTPGTGDAAASFARLDSWMREHFAVEDTAYHWAAQDNDSGDGIPMIGPLHPGARHAYVATGFGGWGMSSGVLAGQLLSGLITGDEVPWAELYDPAACGARCGRHRLCCANRPMSPGTSSATGCTPPTSTPSPRSRRDRARWCVWTGTGAPSTAPRTARSAPSRRAARTWAASWRSTRRRRRGSAPVTVRASPRTGRSFRDRPCGH